ncbi:hypothetical protein [Salibacterium salarium]|uniref:hypothetical protein n=1 Tax=Salibacterium salarium TaxID=284579 RepID=UPI00163A4001|nr:hypothetical protein [Salibacterium salarium]
MVTTISGIENYIENKLIGFHERYGIEHINRYIKLYENISNENLKQLFSIFHYEFNHLFKYMNSRIRNRHYTADESRELIVLIEELRNIQSNVRRTKYDFEIHPYYQERMQE